MHFDLQTKIAFLGMGLMGSRMATRLIQAGFHVAVWNRTPSACEHIIDMTGKYQREFERENDTHYSAYGLFMYIYSLS